LKIDCEHLRRLRGCDFHALGVNYEHKLLQESIGHELFDRSVGLAQEDGGLARFLHALQKCRHAAALDEGYASCLLSY